MKIKQIKKIKKEEIKKPGEQEEITYEFEYNEDLEDE